ncbi:MAG: phosphatidate cytidylyltransferase [Candidatus Dormibacteraceae bacterium]
MNAESSEVETAPPPRSSALWVRVLSAVILLACAAGLLALGRPGFYAIAILAAAFGLWEFRGITARFRATAPIWLLFPLGFFFLFSGTELRWLPVEGVLAVALVCGLSVFLVLPGGAQGLGRWAMGLAGAVYLGVPLNYYILLYTRPSGDRGLLWVVITLAALMLEDATALLFGRRFGRHAFFPRISPKKTWEGAVSGCLIGTAVMLAGTVFLLGVPWWHGLVLGLLVSITGVAGDLVESQLKRLAAVKDSSHLIPGHGGALDRMDSLLFAPVAVFIYATSFHLL